MKQKYEILDSMECPCACADSFEDALYAAGIYKDKLSCHVMIFDNVKGKVVFVEYFN